MKYRRKPLEVEAVQYRIDNLVEINSLIKEVDPRNKILPTFSASSLVIDRANSDVLVINWGDYLVKEENTLYEAAKANFEKYFEKVTEE